MKNKTNTSLKTLFILAFTLAGFTHNVNAEDTEAFFIETPSASNVIFLMDSSDTMSWDLDGHKPSHPGFKAPSRMSILQSALRTVFKEAPSNLNVGLMNFGSNSDEFKCSGKGKKGTCYVDDKYRSYGIHGVALPASNMEDEARKILGLSAFIDNLPWPRSYSIREFIPEVADTWSAEGPSPIVDALYEAALYFRGEKLRWGQDIPSSDIAAHPVTYKGLPITQNRKKSGIHPPSAPLYKTPITSHCQSNYIVLMTDGVPTYYDTTPQGRQGRVPGPASKFFGDASYGKLAAGVGVIDSHSGDGNRGGTNPKGFPAGEGGYELIRYISTHDNDPNTDGVQTIDSFVVGFGPTLGSNEKQYLETLASVDDPDTANVVEGYYSALNGEELAASFKEILEYISNRAISYASPGYSVNVKSGLEHERDVYIPMFNRTNSALWPGNLKKFRINEVSGKRVIQGKNNLNAVDEVGAMTEDALDFWSTSPASEPDGQEVEKGGLANLLIPADRNLFSNLTCNSSCGLNTKNNLLTEANAENSGLITNELLGLVSTETATKRKLLIRFIRGLRDDGSPRYHMGDMMHSEPLIITYSDDGSTKEQYVFVATNEGYLHAFDTTTGKEKFAFMPKELLKNIEPQRFSSSARNHKYGIDGGITFWEDKSNGKKYLYFGMRRGGHSYYALDITNITNPILLWSKSNKDSDYANMGQTWSVPYLARVGVKGKTCTTGASNCKEVVIVSGGYDPAEDRNIAGTLKVDDATSSVSTTMGNDIFIMDAFTGKRIWSVKSDISISNSKLTSSVPGGLRMLDVNMNGLVDRLYFADTAGYVWRLDLSENINGTDSSSKLTEFAQLSDSGYNSRKFYNEPDVALMRLQGKSMFVVSIGSGFRAHPMDKSIDDRFYILLDESPFGDADISSIEEGNLATITISGSGSSTIVTQSGGSIVDADKKGWRVVLPKDGEKVLGTALTFDGAVTFTTLVPESLGNPDECDPPGTHGRFYALNILSGEAGMDLDGDGEITDADAFMIVANGDIPGKPQQVFNPLEVTDVLDDDGDATGEKLCKHPVDIRIGKKLSQATGYSACRLESVYWSDPVSN